MGRGFVLLAMSFALGALAAPKLEKFKVINSHTIKNNVKNIDRKLRARVAKFAGLDRTRYVDAQNRVYTLAPPTTKHFADREQRAIASTTVVSAAYALSKIDSEEPPPQLEPVAQQVPAAPRRLPTLSSASHGILATFEEACINGEPQSCLHLALRAKEPQIIEGAVNELRQNCNQAPGLLSVHSCEKLAAFYESSPIQELRDHDQAYVYYTRACAMAMQLDQQETRARSWVVCVTARDMARQRNGDVLDRRVVQETWKKKTKVKTANKQRSQLRAPASLKRNYAQISNER